MIVKHPVEKTLLETVVYGIPATHANIYDDWCRVIWAIANTAKENIYDALDVADNFSKQSSKYVDPEDVRKIYEKSR